MTETEVRNLIDKLQQTLAETKTFGVTVLSEISAYVVDKKLDINELKNEIVNLKCERNDWKQRAESAKQQIDNLATELGQAKAYIDGLECQRKQDMMEFAENEKNR